MHSAEQLLNDMLAYVEKANAAVAERDMPALAGMDAMVEKLCQRVTELDEATAKTFVPHLEEVFARIEALQGNMVALQEETKAALKALNTTKKANQAYKNATDTKKSED